MSKKKTAVAKTKSDASKAHRLADSPEKVKEAITQIKQHYRVGQRSIATHPVNAPYGRERRDGEPILELTKARKFAKTVEQDELDDVIRLCRTHQTALGLTLIERLVTIEDKQERKRLTRHAIEERWSKSTLEREIRTRFGRRKAQGRKPRRPSDSEQILSDVFSLCLRLTRWGGIWVGKRIQATSEAILVMTFVGRTGMSISNWKKHSVPC